LKKNVLDATWERSQLFFTAQCCCPVAFGLLIPAGPILNKGPLRLVSKNTNGLFQFLINAKRSNLSSREIVLLTFKELCINAQRYYELNIK